MKSFTILKQTEGVAEMWMEGADNSNSVSQQIKEQLRQKARKTQCLRVFSFLFGSIQPIKYHLAGE